MSDDDTRQNDTRQIFRELASISKKLDVYIAGASSCRSKCEQTHKAVFGDEKSVGLKAKVWIIWGALGILLATVTSLAAGWIGS